MDNRAEMIEKYRNVINVLLDTSLYDNIFVDRLHKLNDIAIVKESGLYPEQPEEGNLRRMRKVTADITAVIDRKCNIVIKGCWTGTESNINSIKNIIDKIIKCKWLRINEYGRYNLNNPYLFVLKGEDMRGKDIITLSANPILSGIWKIVECDIDDFEDRYKEYYLKDKHPKS